MHFIISDFAVKYQAIAQVQVVVGHFGRSTPSL
jgi:hypothetical protein